MFAEGFRGVSFSEPYTSFISVDSLSLVKGLNCQTYDGTGKKTNCKGWGGGGGVLRFSKSHVYTALDEG